MTTKADRVRQVLPEALDRVTDSGDMEYFDQRSLWYVVEELYLQNFPDAEFYKEMDSFTQGFLVRWQKKHGRIEGLVRDPRGAFSSPRYTELVGPEFRLSDAEMNERKRDQIQFREANKIIYMEKRGLFESLVANDFPLRLDAALMTSQGYGTELARRVLIDAEQQGLPLLAVHDFDVDGIDIQRSLENPTKRRDFHPRHVIDLGFTWDDVQDLMEDGLRPEPASLNQSQRTKLDTLYEEGHLCYEAHEFLQDQQVKLNVLPPGDLLDFLVDKLRDLDLWKTVPTQRELKSQVDVGVKERIPEVREEVDDRLDEEVGKTWSFRDQVGVQELWSAMMDLNSTIRRELRNRLKEDLEDVYGTLRSEELSSSADVEPGEVAEELEQDPTRYWKGVAHQMAAEHVRQLHQELGTELDAEQYVDEVVALDEVQDLVEKVREAASRLADS